MSCFGYGRLFAVVLLTVFAVPVRTFAAGTLINFTSLDPKHPYLLSGTLYLPENRSGPCPAIVVVHGTMGIDSRGEFYRGSTLAEGIAVFEVDFRTGIYRGPFTRPSPEVLVPMGFAALKALRQLPAIDPDRIGIMGFSMGGHLAVMTAFESNRRRWLGSEKGFATHVAFYPVCGPFLKQDDCQMTGAPLIILYGTEDAYGEGKNVPEFKRLLLEKCGFAATTVEYAGACHGFNRNEPPVKYWDRAATGGRGYMAWDAKAANDSLVRVAEFLKKTLAAR